MVNNQLIKYVQTYLNQGYTEQQIWQSLIKNGYSPQVLKEVFIEVRRQKNYSKFPNQYRQPINHPKAQYDHHHVNKHMLVVVGIIFLIMIIFGTVFWLTMEKSGMDNVKVDKNKIDRNKYTTTTTSSVSTTTTTIKYEEEPEKGSVELYEIKLCNNIDQYFNCYENRYDEYEMGEKVYIYFRIYLDAKQMGNKAYKVGFTEDREVIGPDGNVVSPPSTQRHMMDVSREVPDVGTFSMPIYNIIETTDYNQTGEYTVNLIINDKYSDFKTNKKIKFKLDSNGEKNEDI